MSHLLASRHNMHLTLMAFVAVGFALVATPARALGPSAPPTVTFRAAWVNTQSTNAFISLEEGIPQLYVDVQLLIPGGDVPRDVQSVTVTLPDGVSQFNIPKNANDLTFENEYFRNLTQAGVVGFPTGTYTFTVRDTAGGVTTVTDTLTATTPLLPTTFVAVSGAVQVSNAPGELFSLNLATDPTPTVTWAPVSGAGLHRLRIQAFTNNVVFQHTFNGTTSTLPAGVMVPGRIYRFQVQAESSPNGLPQTDSRSQREIRIITAGPDFSVSASPGIVQTGQTVTFFARVVNTGPPIVVNAQLWLGRPDGTIQEIGFFEGVGIENSTGRPNNDLFNGAFSSLLFTETYPNGTYVLGGRLTDPATGETIAQTSFRFQKS